MTPAERDRMATLEALAAEEARKHEAWSDGMSPSEYLLAVVDRAQARKAASGGS